MTMPTAAPFGISTALLTPFQGDGQINLALLCSHALHMLQSGPRGVTLFGTTGEGASISVGERQDALQAMRDAGVPADAITLGLCASAVRDVVFQVRQGMDFGVTQFLLLPPFYFTDLSDDGLFEWHVQLFEMADPSARFILYHIPQITQVPLSFDLIRRLHETFPDRVIGVKDSAGQWENTCRLLENGDFPVLVGDERLLHRAFPMGAAGSICGMANLFPARLAALFDKHIEDTALSSDVDLIVSGPVIPALKQAMVTLTGNPEWGHLRVPLQALPTAAKAAIDARFAAWKADVS